MARPIWTLLAAVLLIAPCAAFAQSAAPADDQVVNTAPSGPAAPPKATPSGQVASVADAVAEQDAEDDAPVRDNRVHGEISVGAGTNGYRQVSGVATVPLGDNGSQATIAVDSEQMNYHR